MLAEPERLRRTLGYLPQDFGVYPRVSAYAMLDHMAVLKGITGKGERKSVVETLLNQTNLWEVRDKAIAGFSGGMRQRFGIAQALIGNPELIIVDEPTAGLDPEERNRFLNLLAGIGDNVVVILSTHIVDDVADLCPRMAVLANGRLQLEGKPADLIASTRGKVWKKTIDHAELEQYQAEPRGHLDPPVRRQHDRPRPVRHAARGVRAGRGRARGCLFLDPVHASPRSLSGDRTCCSASPRFEIRYQLKNPVFWVAIAIFFLLGFGLTASENVSIGTPGAVHENAPFAIAIATAVLTLFYLFVVTAFVANAIVRDETSGFAPIVRATSVTRIQIVARPLPRRADHRLARLSRGAARHGARLVDAVGRSRDRRAAEAGLLRVEFRVFALPNIFLTSALLFALATVLRSMMAAYIGAVVLVMGYLVTTSIVGQKIEYRETFARFEPLGNGALARGDPLLDPGRDEQPAGRPRRRPAVQPPVRDRARRCCSSASPCGASR